jgi:CheY-like chemotaxis protein
MDADILTGKNVLVAEDNAINQMVVKHALLKLGATAEIVPDGAEAIEKFKRNKYDLILMDIQMPLVDGYEATAYIRNQLHSDIPIIAMTAFGLNGEDEKCQEYGMNSYVAKPFTIETLSNSIKKVLTLPTPSINNPYLLVNQHVAVDVSMLYDISGNDESYINMMVQTFLENMPNTLKKIEQSLHEEDWDAVYRAAHYAKSSLSVVKISEMFDAIITIEVNAKNKTNLDTIAPLLKNVQESFVLAEQALAKKFSAETKTLD